MRLWNAQCCLGALQCASASASLQRSRPTALSSAFTIEPRPLSLAGFALPSAACRTHTKVKRSGTPKAGWVRCSGPLCLQAEQLDPAHCPIFSFHVEPRPLSLAGLAMLSACHITAVSRSHGFLSVCRSRLRSVSMLLGTTHYTPCRLLLRTFSMVTVAGPLSIAAAATATWLPAADDPFSGDSQALN